VSVLASCPLAGHSAVLNRAAGMELTLTAPEPSRRRIRPAASCCFRQLLGISRLPGALSVFSAIIIVIHPWPGGFGGLRRDAGGRAIPNRPRPPPSVPFYLPSPTA